MRSKVLQFSFGVAVILALCFGVNNFTANKQFKANNDEIGRLLLAAQSVGFTADGDGFVKKLPDDQNTWVEIGRIVSPLIDPKSPQGAFQNRNTIALNSYALPSDLPLFDSAYTFKKSDLDMMIMALKRKGHFQIPRNYNEGYMMEYPEMDVLKVLANDIALAALAKAYRRDIVGALDTLRSDYVLGAALMDLNETIPRKTGMEIFKVISKVEMRLIEFDPSIIEPIKKQFEEWAPKFDRDPFDEYKWSFLKDIAICRNYDDPIMDKPHLGWPLEKLSHYPKGKEVDQYLKVKSGTNIPDSPAMRKCLLDTLRRWNSALKFINDPKTKHNIQAVDKITDLVARERDCPKPLQERWQDLAIGNSLSEEFRGITNIDLKHEMFRQLEYRQKNGEWSKMVLGPIREYNSSIKYRIIPLKGGIQIGGGNLNSDGQAIYRFCFPHNIGLLGNNTSLEIITKIRKKMVKATS